MFVKKKRCSTFFSTKKKKTTKGERKYSNNIVTKLTLNGIIFNYNSFIILYSLFPSLSKPFNLQNLTP